MKKILVLLVSVFAMFAYDSVASNNENSTSPQTENSPQVCKFSLSCYTGTLQYKAGIAAYTPKFRVYLNCPQTEDVCATVSMFVEGELITSKVVCISKGSTASEEVHISVPYEYKEKKYTLTVE